MPLLVNRTYDDQTLLEAERLVREERKVLREAAAVIRFFHDGFPAYDKLLRLAEDLEQIALEEL